MDNEQKRTLTAFLLIIVILLIWSFIAKPTGQKVLEKKEGKLSRSTTNVSLKRKN